MANVIGSGTGRFLTDETGDPITTTDGRLDVNTTIGLGSSTFTTYGQDTATATAQTITELIATGRVQVCKEIIIQADFDNPSFIMIGDGDVSTDDTEGIRLQAGDMLTLPVSDTDDVSVRAPDTSQKLNISIIT